MSLSPILIFTQKRKDNFLILIDSLLKNKESKHSDVFIFIDGLILNESEENIYSRNFIIEYINKLRFENYFKSITVFDSQINNGLKKSILDGISTVFNLNYDKVIVLEDDLVLSEFFLDFMNSSLDLYINHPNITTIGSCNYFKISDKCFVSPLIETWGWATWKNKWINYSFDSAILLDNLNKSNLLREFNLFGFYNFEAMLSKQIIMNNSWAVNCQAENYLNNWLCLYPYYNLSQHRPLESGINAPHLVIKEKLSKKSIDAFNYSDKLIFFNYFKMIIAYRFVGNQGFYQKMKAIIAITLKMAYNYFAVLRFVKNFNKKC